MIITKQNGFYFSFHYWAFWNKASASVIKLRSNRSEPWRYRRSDTICIPQNVSIGSSFEPPSSDCSSRELTAATVYYESRYRPLSKGTFFGRISFSLISHLLEHNNHSCFVSSIPWCKAELIILISLIVSSFLLVKMQKTQDVFDSFGACRRNYILIFIKLLI